MFLDEGTDHLTLEDGVLLTVYASPYTPALGAWGFPYHPDQVHNFSIERGVDIVITYGPPKGIMDYTYGRERVECPHLFAAVTRARPRVHCFGHIHEGWGARLVTWRDDSSEQPTHFTAIDNDRPHVIEKLASLDPSRLHTQGDAEQKVENLERNKQDGYFMTNHCNGDEYPLEYGKQTLFVNASITGNRGLPLQWPWLVNIDPPRAR
jgi:hypothetical protein